MQSSATDLKGRVLSRELRDKLRLDPSLGAGNFLHVTLKVNPNPDLPAVFLDKKVNINGRDYSQFSIIELAEVANWFASWYLSQGIKWQDPVAVYTAEGIDYLIQYIAITSIGAIPVLTNGAMETKTALGHFQRMGAVGVFTDQVRKKALTSEIRKESPFNFITVSEDLDGYEAGPLPEWFPYQHDDLDPIMITHSSGTTGVPKGVLLQHGKWFYGVRHLLGLPAASGIENYLSSLPTSHNAAISYAMHAILNGSKLTIVSDLSGEAVAGSIERFKPSTIVSFPQTYVQLSELPNDQFDLSSVSTWINSGDSAHQTHIRKLVQYGTHYRGEIQVNGSQFIDGLGSSEMGHSLFRIIHTPYTQTYDRCVGFPQRWVEAEVLDELGNKLGEGEVGQLGIKAPTVTSGYWNDDVRTYRSRLAGYWLTGDLVYRDRLGCFYHVDRKSDRIHTDKGTVYSLLTEELLMKHCPEIADCTVIGVPLGEFNEPIALIRLHPDSTLTKQDLVEKLNQILDENQAHPLLDAIVVRVDEVPVGVTGKVLKRVLRERYKDHARKLTKKASKKDNQKEKSHA